MSSRIFKYSVRLWLLVTTIGQWLFVGYILGHFGKRFFNSGLIGFKNASLPDGYIEGDLLGNIFVALHVLIPAYIMSFGILQLYPFIRKRYLSFHKVNGSIYIFTSIIVSLIGVYMTWFREMSQNELGSDLTKVGTTSGGLLVIFFSLKAIRCILKKDIHGHERWALRAFMAISAVWFFRILGASWIALTGGKGMNIITYEGPFLTFVHFGQWLVPLFFLEMYFWARDHKSKLVSRVVGMIIIALTILTLIGLFGLVKYLWFPRIS